MVQLVRERQLASAGGNGLLETADAVVRDRLREIRGADRIPLAASRAVDTQLRGHAHRNIDLSTVGGEKHATVLRE